MINLRKDKRVEIEQTKDKKGELLIETCNQDKMERTFRRVIEYRYEDEGEEVEGPDMEDGEEDDDIAEEEPAKAIK